jgi:ribosome-associated protein
MPSTTQGDQSTPMTDPVSEREVEFTAIRAQGPGGQNVNKTSNAVQLRFTVASSTLSEAVKLRLLAMADQRITKDGVIVIKAQGSRSLEANKAEALVRLQEMVAQASVVAKTRRPTRPTLGSKQRRLTGKAVRSVIKAGRGRVEE